MSEGKKTLTNITEIPTNMLHNAGRLVTQREVEKLPIWKKMDSKGRAALMSDIQHAAGAKLMHTAGGLAMGKYLKNVYDRCETYSTSAGLKSSFCRISEDVLGIHRRMAYRYKDTYVNLEGIFPETVLEAAVIEGMKILSFSKTKPLGKYTEAVKVLPPPPNPDPATAIAYIRNLEKTYKMSRRARGLPVKERDTEAERAQRDPEFLQMNLFRGIKNALEKVPARQRMQWFDDLVGYSLHQMGIASSVSFKPQAPPEWFRQGPGRPPKVHEAA